MGFIRGGLALIVGILLFISFLVGNSFLTFNLSINPDNIKEGVSSNIDVIVDSVEKEANINLTKEIEDKIPAIESYCENNAEFVFSLEGYTIDIPCEVAEEGSNAIVAESAGDVVEGVYYTEYNCDSFWKCALNPKNPFYLFSEQAKQSWKNVFYYSLLISLVLIAVMFVLIENKSSFFITLGFLLIVSSLPFLKIGSFFNVFDNSLVNFVSVLFSKASLVFWIDFVTGLVLIAIGVGLKFFNLGMFFMNMFDRNNEKIVKKNFRKRN